MYSWCDPMTLFNLCLTPLLPHAQLFATTAAPTFSPLGATSYHRRPHAAAISSRLSSTPPCVESRAHLRGRRRGGSLKDVLQPFLGLARSSCIPKFGGRKRGGWRGVRRGGRWGWVGSLAECRNISWSSISSCGALFGAWITTVIFLMSQTAARV